MASFDTIIFSGGGFKGAYGAGAAKAITDYYRLRKVSKSLCFVGNSAGALNAAVLATSSVDDLIHFWMNLRPKQVFGCEKTSLFSLCHLYLRWRFSKDRTKPFSVYPNKPRENLIRKAISFEAIKKNNRHLIVVATDFVYAEARAFYCSSLVDRMKEDDDTKLLEDRRFAHCSPIQSQDELVKVLLGSTALPLVFPPVEIEYLRLNHPVKSLFVDGGIGNNVPTREAAYFHRRLKDLDLGEPENTFCIKLSPPRVVADNLGNDPFSILGRTYDVYDFIHMERIVHQVHLINHSVDQRIEDMEHFAELLRDKVKDAALEKLLSEKADTTFVPRQRFMPLIEIAPSSSLGRTLDFSRHRIHKNITMGYDDTVNVLENRAMIGADERMAMINGFRLDEYQ